MDAFHQIFIKEFMVTKVHSLSEDSSMVDAYNLMFTYNVRHLPVLNKAGEVIGLFADTDLERACPPHETETGWHYSKSELSQFILAHFMSTEPLLLTPEDTLGKAAAEMADHKNSCILIVKPGTKKLAGIITAIDILRVIGKIIT